MSTIDIHPSNTRRLSFDEFLALSDSERANIVRTRIVAPDFSIEDLESEDAFGQIEVCYKHAIYESALDCN